MELGRNFGSWSWEALSLATPMHIPRLQNQNEMEVHLNVKNPLSKREKQNETRGQSFAKERN